MEGMIGYTRAFVQDFRQGLNHVSLERFDWMNQLANKKWAGISVSVWVGLPLAVNSFLLLLPFKARFRFKSSEITPCLHGGTQHG